MSDNLNTNGADGPNYADADTFEDITIAAQSFKVPSPFAEGHVCTAGEAAKLNQVLHDAIRNNMATRIKDKGAGQAEVDNFVSTYSMGSHAGGRTSDPVMREAMRLARDSFVAGLRKRGEVIKNWTAESITEHAKHIVSTDGRFLERAKRNVADQIALEDTVVSEAGVAQ